MSTENTDRMSIAELERILSRDDEVMLEILPNGEIRLAGETTNIAKPLTMRENLGGEYAQ